MSENPDKIKSLKKSLEIREKELLTVFKELDYYRRKCKKLKLLLLKQKSEGLNTKSSDLSQSVPEIVEPLPCKRPKIEEISNSSQIKSFPKSLDTEDGEIDEPKPKSQTVKKKKKTAVTKFMDSLISGKIESSKNSEAPKNSECSKPISSVKIDAKMTSQSKISEPSLDLIQNILQKTNENNNSKPNLRQKQNSQAKNIAYNKPYSMLSTYTEINYNSLNQQPIQYTPMTVSLSSLNPQTNQFKEQFEICKRIYIAGDFSATFLCLLSETLKVLDPSTAATYLVNEILQCYFIFSPSDALSIMYTIIKDIVRDPTWDKVFFNSLRPFFTQNETITFVGKEIKMPSLKYSVSNLQEIIFICFMLVCEQQNYFHIVRKLIGKMLKTKNLEVIRKTYEMWKDLFEKSYSLHIFHNLVVLDVAIENILKELVVKIKVLDEKEYHEVYLSCKGIFRYLSIMEAYEAYGKYLYNLFSEAKKNSSTRVLVIDMIGVLYLEFEKEGSKKTHFQLRGRLEEILTDKKMMSNC